MKSITCLAFILFSIINTFSQETAITEDEFLAVLAKANKPSWEMKSSPYKITLISEIVLKFKQDDFDRPLSSFKTVLEKDGKFASHYVYELSKNSLKEKFESVQIRGNYFERKDDGNWMQISKPSKILVLLALPSPRKYKDTEKSSEAHGRSIEYKYLGKEEITNQIADVYMTTENSTKGEPSGNKIITSEIRKFWFAQDGEILKLDVKIKIDSNGNTSHTHNIQTWEADENIRIETPISPVAQ